MTHEITVPDSLWAKLQGIADKRNPAPYCREILWLHVAAVEARTANPGPRALPSKPTAQPRPPLYPGVPLQLREPTTCSECRRALRAGVNAWFYTDERDHRQIECPDCHDLKGPRQLHLGE